MTISQQLERVTHVHAIGSHHLSHLHEHRRAGGRSDVHVPEGAMHQDIERWFFSGRRKLQIQLRVPGVHESLGGGSGFPRQPGEPRWHHRPEPSADPAEN